MFPNLAAFARWVFEQPFSSFRAPVTPVTHYTNPPKGALVTGVVLHREVPFQVELISVAPSLEGTLLPEHRHPNVDSIEAYVSGAVGFTIRGVVVASSDPTRWPAAKLGSVVRVRPTDNHGAYVGAEGAVFLSVQRWLNAVPPSSVGLDWIGPPRLAMHV